MSYDALTIAKWFVAWAETDEADLSNLKLQKLLYYGQGHHLARYGDVLFSDPIDAWSHGPVVKAVYHEFKRFGSGDLALDERDEFAWEWVDEDTTEFLIEVWATYAPFGAWKLRNMTHAEPPWRETFQEGWSNLTIPTDRIADYFGSLPQ